MMKAFTETLKLSPSDLDRLHSFHIPDDLLELHELRRVSDAEARNDCGIQYRGDLTGVAYPIFGADDAIKGYRVRRDNPEMEAGKPKAKYVQSVDRPHLYFERSSRQHLTDVSVPVVFVEAYTSALAIAALCQRTGRKLLIVAMGGCWGWRGAVGKVTNENGARVDEKGSSPDLDHIAWTGRKTITCLDSNVESNPKVGAAERAFQLEQEKRGAQPYLARIPEEPGINGPDDFIARYGDEAFLQILDGAAYVAWPEPQPIRHILRPVPPLPAALIPDPFRPWLTDISERMQCPLDFVAVAAIVVCGSVIGAGCGVRPKRHDDWTVVPNLWGGVVGRPSIVLKSPSLQEAIRPLERLAAEARESYSGALKTHEADKEAFKAQQDSIVALMKQAARGKKSKESDAPVDMTYAKSLYEALEPPKPPTWRRYKTNDATIEKLGELLADNPRGILVFRDELIGLLSGWDQQGREGDRAFFLEAWNGTGSHETDRIGRGSLRIERACISLLGGIQPAKLQTYLHAAMRGEDNDGFVQRLQLLVYPDEPPVASIVDRYPDSQSKNHAYAIIRKLADANFVAYGAIPAEESSGIPYFRFNAAAQEDVYTWLSDLSQKLRRDDEEPVVIEHLGKYRSLMPSLALIFHLVDIVAGDTEAGPIPLKAARRAMAWCDFLEAHARRIYALVTDIRYEAAYRLSRKILSGELPGPFTVRDVYRKHWGLLDDKDIIEAACDELVERGWLREQDPIWTGGRPKGTEYAINPRLTSGTFGTTPSARMEKKNEVAE